MNDEYYSLLATADNVRMLNNCDPLEDVYPGEQHMMTPLDVRYRQPLQRTEKSWSIRVLTVVWFALVVTVIVAMFVLIGAVVYYSI